MSRLRLVVLFAAVYVATGLNAQVAGRLSGSVVDPTGASIPGAAVNVFVPGGKEPVLTGVTNDAGLFSFIAVYPDLPLQSIEIHALAAIRSDPANRVCSMPEQVGRLLYPRVGGG